MRPSVRHRAVSFTAAALIVTSTLLSSVASARGNEGHRSPLLWILFDEGGTQAQHPGAAGPETVLNLVKPGQIAGADIDAADAEVFTSYAAFDRAVAQRTIPARLRYVAYDPEKWATTPSAEQLAPRHYMKLFTKTAHGRGLRAIIVPGLDLLLAPGAPCAKHRGTTLDQAFVKCDLAAGGAHANIFVVQGAPIETDPQRFETLIRKVASQIHRVSRSTELVVTLATARASVEALSALANRVRRYVQGFEINTSTGQEATAVDLMREVGS